MPTVMAAHHRRSTPCSILYLCYLGVNEPLVQTQVIPYLGGLARADHRVVLLTFEPHRLAARERTRVQEALRGQGIEWRSLRYHRRPAVPATAVDILAGIACAAYLIRSRHIEVVHARGDVPAAMAIVLKRLFGTRMLFDIRGLMADEYADAGLWKRDGMLYRLTRRLEAIALAYADAVVVLTRRAKAWVLKSGRLRDRAAPVEIIPCCVDLPRFQVHLPHVRRLRTDLGFDGGPVMVYVGKLGGWYMTHEMVDFFRVARRHMPGLRFLVLTQSDAAGLEGELVGSGVPRHSYHCVRVSAADIPTYLSIADFAISFIAPCFSKLASSPTKMAEYLAAGLPIVFNEGIGDLHELKPERVGVLVRGFTERDYESAAGQIQSLLEDRRATAARCRTAARRHFSLAGIGIPRYLRLYSTLRSRNGVDGRFESAPDLGEGLVHTRREGDRPEMRKVGSSAL